MKKYSKYIKTASLIIVSILVGVTAVYATPGNKLIPIGTASNTMYSLTDIWNLASGTTTDEGSGDIETTPALAETGKTLTQVYTAIADEIGNITTNASKILLGTTLFGVSGTMPDHTGASDFAPTSTDVSIPTGFYDGTTKVLGDADLEPTNIKSGTNIFGVDGSLITTPLYGDNDASQVLNTASNPGTFDPNTLSVTYDTSHLTTATVKSGTTFGNSQTGDYPSASNPLPGDTGTTDATNSSVLSGFEAWTKSGSLLTGSAILALGDAIASNVLSGKYFSNGTTSNVLGTMTDQAAKSYTPSNVAQTITAGYYNGSGTVATDVNLVASNIKSGVTIFGVTGNVVAGASAPTFASADVNQYNCSWFTTMTDTTITPTRTSATICAYNTGCTWNAGASTCDGGVKTGKIYISWYAGKAACANSTEGGQTAGTWHLPTYGQLVDHYVNNNTSGGNPPTGFASDYYWSGTTYPSSTASAYYVDMVEGGAGGDYKSNESYFLARCAR